MKKLLLLAFILNATNAISEASHKTNKADLKAGEEKAAACAACHGPKGTGINPDWPKLAGQHSAYLEKQLSEFKTGVRKDPVMQGQATPLTETDIKNLAAYFSSIETKFSGAGSTSDKQQTTDLLARGRTIYKAGIKGVAACSSCHGPSGLGVASAKYPQIAGQYSKYTIKQLTAFKTAANIDELSSSVDKATLISRSNDPSKMMRDNAANLSDRDIEAVAYYIQGLRP